MNRHSISFEEKKADYVFFFLPSFLRGEEVQENMEKRILSRWRGMEWMEWFQLQLLHSRWIGIVYPSKKKKQCMFFFSRALISREKLKKELKKELKGCSSFSSSIVYPCNMQATYWQHTCRLHAMRCSIVYTCNMRATCVQHVCNMRATYSQYAQYACKLRTLSTYTI